MEIYTDKILEAIREADTLARQKAADRSHIRRRITSAAALFCAAALIIVSAALFLPVRGEERIYEDVVRLHILANSDSDADQSLKYALRDYMAEYIAALTSDCGTAGEARQRIETQLDGIEELAGRFIHEQGYSYPVTVKLGEEQYPAREYGSQYGEEFIFPAGTYTSLRILIGSGEGKNWWCVLFPPICLSASKIEDELMTAGYTGEQIKILKAEKGVKYQIRFKLLEWLASLIK